MNSVRLALLVWFLAVCASVLARADDRWPAWTDDDVLAGAQAIQAEIDDSNRREAAAILWTLTRRWRMSSADAPIAATIRSYCAMWDVRSRRYYAKRSIAIRASSLQSAPELGYRTHWPSLIEFVRDFAGHRVHDPCPGATHFGGPMDVHIVPPSWRVVCGPPEFANTFWKETKGE